MRRVDTCRICSATPTVGYLGLCQQCSDAVSRFIALRRENLAARRRA